MRVAAAVPKPSHPVFFFKAKPPRVFRFTQVHEAHRVIEANEAKGKMMVLVDAH